IRCSASCGAAMQDCLGFCYSASNASCVLHKSSALSNSTMIVGMRSYSYYPAAAHATAFANCRALNSYLAIPATASEVTDIRAAANGAGGIWIGIDAVGHNGQIFTSGSPADYGDQPVKYAPFAPGQPQYLATTEQCLMIWTNGFHDVSCTALLQYVCQSFVPYSCVALPHPAYSADYMCYSRL
ncbi:uncharacterized protein LOC108671083, partial [Hyalella azteca]|uniref:Uncharacterized protein LOC108671083 n=1 Tax=Hyalella azteca TaxID=294128 RepID=A0A8B7NK73_HYAAZ